jgi:hypothetical protein
VPPTHLGPRPLACQKIDVVPRLSEVAGGTPRPNNRWPACTPSSCQGTERKKMNHHRWALPLTEQKASRAPGGGVRASEPRRQRDRLHPLLPFPPPPRSHSLGAEAARLLEDRRATCLHRGKCPPGPMRGHENVLLGARCVPSRGAIRAPSSSTRASPRRHGMRPAFPAPGAARSPAFRLPRIRRRHQSGPRPGESGIPDEAQHPASFANTSCSSPACECPAVSVPRCIAHRCTLCGNPEFAAYPSTACDEDSGQPDAESLGMDSGTDAMSPSDAGKPADAASE